MIDSVIDHTISISKYNPLAGSSYIKLPKELDHPRKGLINTQNIDNNKCFKWCLVRYLNPADHNLVRITKADKVFAKKLDFKDIKFPVKVRDIHKIENQNSIGIIIRKTKHPIYVFKKCCKEKDVDLLLIKEKRKRQYVLIKDFNRFMYNHTLNCRKKHLCWYPLQAFSIEEMLKYHIKDCFKINGKKL